MELQLTQGSVSLKAGVRGRIGVKKPSKRRRRRGEYSGSSDIGSIFPFVPDVDHEVAKPSVLVCVSLFVRFVPIHTFRDAGECSCWQAMNFVVKECAAQQLVGGRWPANGSYFSGANDTHSIPL